MDEEAEIFEKKRKTLKDEIQQVEDRTHPELVEKFKAIEEYCDDWLNYRLPFAVKQMEHDAKLRFEAAVELAKKRYSESVEEIRESMLRQLKEERAQIEYDYYNDGLDDSDGLFLIPSRNLRTKPKETPLACGTDKKTSKPVRALNTTLSKAEIKEHLRLIRSFSARKAKGQADEGSSSGTKAVPADELVECTFDGSEKLGD